jgi:hypothetical protein
MKHKNSHLLVGYWSRLRANGNVPDQTDIDPRAIKRMLSQVFILDATIPTRPIYRLAGTGLCERFGFELKGTSFLAHWEGGSATSLGSLLKQAMTLQQPVCLSSIGATADCGMVELETILAPISFNGEEPTRFLGITQILSDVTHLGGRPIAFQRLIASQLVRESEPLSNVNPPPPPPVIPPSQQIVRNHPRAPHLRLVVSQDRPGARRLSADNVLERMFATFGGGAPAA